MLSHSLEHKSSKAHLTSVFSLTQEYAERSESGDQNKVNNVALSVLLIGENHPHRASAQAFIKDGFTKAYGADISVSMPNIIAIQKAHLKAALGVRSAESRLFVEQYLPKDIDAMLADIKIDAKRTEIAEIGHLYANASQFMLSLLIATALILHQQGSKYMVFTATSQLSALFEKFELAPQFLANADPKKLLLSHQHWGTYYDTSPRVMVLCLDDVKQLIQSRALFNNMALALAPQIDEITHDVTLKANRVAA
jgi:hypothetical protein